MMVEEWSLIFTEQTEFVVNRADAERGHQLLGTFVLSSNVTGRSLQSVAGVMESFF
jgi:hypothetical protein